MTESVRVSASPYLDDPGRRLLWTLPMAALILAALAISAAAQQQVPFKGTFQGNDNTATHGTIITTGTGIGALVGHSH